eukprot:6184965-Pleurochrysis_carterae.AAC.1
MCVCLYLRVCVCARARARARARVGARVGARVRGCVRPCLGICVCERAYARAVSRGCGGGAEAEVRGRCGTKHYPSVAREPRGGGAWGGIERADARMAVQGRARHAARVGTHPLQGDPREMIQNRTPR